jgi:hypothetical protein
MQTKIPSLILRMPCFKRESDEANDVTRIGPKISLAIALSLILITTAKATSRHDVLGTPEVSVASIAGKTEYQKEGQVIAMRPERDPEAIVQDAFDEAVRNRSAGGLIKFISRNPEHPLAERARQLLKTGKYAPARKTATEFFDSKIVEFDAARRAGPEALKAYIAKYPDHPLSKEARRLLER